MVLFRQTETHLGLATWIVCQLVNRPLSVKIVELALMMDRSLTCFSQVKVYPPEHHSTDQGTCPPVTESFLSPLEQAFSLPLEREREHVWVSAQTHPNHQSPTS